MSSMTTRDSADTGQGVTLTRLVERDEAIVGPGPAWLHAVRGSALERARELGMPRKTDEEWRYTDPQPILEQELALPEASAYPGRVGVEALEVEASARLVFVDGRFAPAMSDLDRLPAGVTLAPLDHAGTEPPDQTLQSIVADAIDRSRDGFEALGAGLLTTGVVVRVQPGVSLERPIVLVFRAEDAATALLTAPQVTVVAEEGARLEVIEDHQGAGGAAGLTLGRTNLRVGVRAHVEHTSIQREPTGRHHVSTLDLVQQGESFCRSTRLLLGGAITRNNILATLEGERIEAAFNGLFLPEHRQHQDTHIRVEHMAPNCHSRQYYRGLLADRARGVFTGRIYVQDVAQKTDAIQSNSNLLLAPTAQVTTKPQLEIYADDVRCTHGATSGQLDEDALFYLRARGVPDRTARLLLLHAFAGENVDRIGNDDLREVVRRIINDRLDAALTRCA